MGRYRGETWRVPANRGGWNANPNTDLIPAESMSEAININLHNGGRETRGGTEEVNGTPISGAPRIMGIFQFRKKNGNTFIVTATTDGKIQKDYATDLKTGLATGKFSSFVVFNDHLYICNEADMPQKWDGVSTSTYPIGGVPHPATACVGALAGAGAGNVDDGTHSYKVTFVTAEGETDPNIKSNVVTVADKATDGQVNLTSIPLGPTSGGPTVTDRKIYRTVAGDTGNWKLLTTIADNTTTTYTDNTADAGLGADAPTTNGTARVPTDWTGTNFPKRIVRHGRGASERLWAFGCPSNLERIYAGATGDDNFLDASVVTIDIETGDGFGIVGMEEYGDRLIPVGKRQPYLIDDLDADSTKWGYDPAQWEGGLGNDRLLVKTPNDLIAMSEDGEIYSVIVTQQTGDYRSASIARPAFIHKWIEDHVDLAQIDDFHMVYDQAIRAIKIFVIRKGQIKTDTALVFFIDRPPEEAWVRHRYVGLDFASVATVVRVAAGNWKIYAGGHAGTAYKLESTTLTDNGVHYDSSFLTIDDPFANPRVNKRYDRDWLVLKPQGEEIIGVNVYVDGRAIVGAGFRLVDENGNSVVDESGNNITSEAGVAWTITPTAGARLVNESNPLGIIGIRKQTEIKQTATGKRMFISQLLSDHVVLGPAAH